MTDVWSLFARRVHPEAPLVTWIDGADRIELSATTVANAVAKGANTLDLALGAGPRIHLALPWHWQLPVWQGAVWVSGRTLVDDHPDLRLAAEDIAEPGCLAVSLDPWGMPITRDLPAGVEDITALVRAQPDVLIGRADHSTSAAIAERSQDRVIAQAAELAGRLGVGPGDRLLALPGDPVIAHLVPLLVPLVSGCSVLLATVDHPDEAITRSTASLPTGWSG